MRVAYADPPYPGMAHLYRDHEDYDGEVAHADLIARLDDYDAWALHTASSTLQDVLALCPDDVRILAWVKTWASLKPGVWPFYAWEPVLIRGARRCSMLPTVHALDWFAWPISTGKGLKGAKPREVVEWVFRCLGLEGDDELSDLFPGTGIVGRTWASWRAQPPLWEAPREPSPPDLTNPPRP